MSHHSNIDHFSFRDKKRQKCVHVAVKGGDKDNCALEMDSDTWGNVLLHRTSVMGLRNLGLVCKNANVPVTSCGAMRSSW